uniref:Uncharacterized protein n=1 Tax=Fagus sylvatica TaxID=28930 RepID=A0A2N9IIL9_FAGSY
MSVFDDLGVTGKLALPSLLKFWTCKEASLGSRDTVPANRGCQSASPDEGSFSNRDSGLTREALKDPRVARCS